MQKSAYVIPWVTCVIEKSRGVLMKLYMFLVISLAISKNNLVNFLQNVI